MSMWEGEGYQCDHAQSENARLLQAKYEGERKARMLAHRYKQPEVARSIHANCLAHAEIHAKRGNVCMAHAKRLQAKYWARRMVVKVEKPTYTIHVDTETGNWTFAQEAKP